METVPLEKFPERDAKTFIRFLSYCQRVARQKRHPQLVSVCLEVKAIDPLAVLQSIYEQQHLHFYLEKPEDETALAAAEAVLEKRFTGKDRFAEARQFALEVSENTIAIGDLHSSHLKMPDRSALQHWNPGDCAASKSTSSFQRGLGQGCSGPKFFCAFTFDKDESPRDGGFSPGTVFIPRWQVEQRGQTCFAIANTLVEADSDLEVTAGRILAAHEKFSTFSYTKVNQGSPPQVQQTLEVGAQVFEDSVAQALDQIKQKHYEKIVLARAVEAIADKPFIPLETLNRLRQHYPSCFCFSVNNGTGQSFIGATPERLVGCQNKILKTEALAGSAKRGSSAYEDAEQANALLSSDKDLREHRMVIESIRQRLEALGIQPQMASTPQLLQLANVQHLRTPIRGTMPDGLHLLDLAGTLHPTPAVGGYPRAAAVPQIRALEGFPRGLFAGLVGWFDMVNQGELVVGLRSGLFSGNCARLYAGAGIVEGSEPDRERAETAIKLRALQEGIQ